MITTPKRKMPVEIEASVENFEWLAKACQYEWPRHELASTYIPRDKAGEDLPELEPPLKHRTLKNSTLKMYVWYRKLDGAWKTKEMTVPAPSGLDESALGAIIRSKEAAMLEFFDINHHAADGACPPEGADPLPHPEDEANADAGDASPSVS